MKGRFLFRAVAYWQLFEASVRRRTANVVRSVLFSQHDVDDALASDDAGVELDFCLIFAP
jgi:hypothetical protein